MRLPSGLETDRRALMLGAAATAATAAAPARAAVKPNVIFIMADDLGYADLSCYGQRAFETPVLDKLAAQGLKLTHGYSNSPICSPTRVALLTGRYHQRFPVGLPEPGGRTDLFVPPEKDARQGRLF